MRVRNYALYGKYLVQDLDLNVYKRTTTTTKNNNLYIQHFSPGTSHLEASFFYSNCSFDARCASAKGTFY